MTSVACAAVAGRADDLSLLTEHERARHDRLADRRDRAAYLAAHVEVRALAATELGCAIRDVVLRQRCEACGAEDHGAPHVADHPELHVSLSHTRGLVAAVVSDARCGVDVEPVPAEVPWRVLGSREVAWLRGQDEAPMAFARLWVRKEALAKAGEGRVEEIDALGPGGPVPSYGPFRLEERVVDGPVGAPGVRFVCCVAIASPPPSH